MTLISLLLINFIWILYSVTEGSIEGFYWHYENMCKKACDFNINPVFNLQRFLVSIILTAFMSNYIGPFSLLITTSLLLEFSFFHNGTYYYTRNKLGGKVYPKGWKDESKTFPPFAPLMKYKHRTTALILGVVLQVLTYLLIK